jgi:hypothetical protein
MTLPPDTDTLERRRVDEHLEGAEVHPLPTAHLALQPHSLPPEALRVRYALRTLHLGYVALPIIAGMDKFSDALVEWEKYLAPQIARRWPTGASGFMRLVGGVEVAAGVLVAFKPRLGGYVVGAWLGGIIGNLLLGRQSYDIALRDFGLMLGALTLGHLAGVPASGMRPAAAAHLH